MSKHAYIWPGQLAKLSQQSDACGCIGPQNGEPKCPCAMRDVIVVATGFDISIDWLDESVLDPNDGHPEFLLGALSKRFETLYAMGVIHPSRADAWALFDQLGHIIVADILARDFGINVDGMRRLRTEYRPNLKGDFPFLQTRRNANQADTVALENMLNTLRATYGLEIPTAKQAGFFTAARATAN